MSMTDEQCVKWLLQKTYDVGYRYIAMDKGGETFLYKNKPVKEESAWRGLCGNVYSWLYEIINPLVSWEDEAPFDIGKYLGIVDWANVPADTKVFVSDDGRNWERRYFKRYNKLIRENNEEYPYACFLAGCTSWSSGDECYEVGWKYCKLAEGE